jgi:hypothetical protein
MTQLERKKYIFGSNRKGVALTEDDIYILEILYKHRLLSLRQIQLYAAHKNFKHNTIQKALKRWERYSLVKGKEFKLKQHGVRIVYYRIGKNGIDILANEGRISGDEIESNQFSLFNDRKLEHYFGTQEIVTKASIELQKANLHFESINPYSTSFVNVVVPDWMMKTSNASLYIELDTGTESQNTKVKEKIDKYKVLASAFPNENHFVLFAIMDESIPTKNNYSSNREKRIAGLKRNFLTNRELEQSNLHAVVVSLNRASSIAFKILSGEYPYSAAVRSDEINSVNYVWTELTEKFNYEIEPISNEGLYMAYVDRTMYADGHFQFFDKQSKTKKIAMYVFMEEGNVNDLERLRMLNSIQARKEFKNEIHFIFGIYPSMEELESDVIGEVLPYVLLGEKKRWVYERDNWPLYYRMVTPFTKEEVRLNEI